MFAKYAKSILLHPRIDRLSRFCLNDPPENVNLNKLKFHCFTSNPHLE
jgi:hypothetical protein